MSPLTRWAGFGLVLLAITGCADRRGGVTVQAEVANSFKTGPAPRVVVEVFNGGIDVVSGIEDGVVRARVTKRGAGANEEEARADLENIDVQMKEEGDAIRIVARRVEGKPHRGNRSASAHLEVPAGTILDLKTSNGHVNVTGLTGEVATRTSNGGIKVLGSKGPLKLHTSNGRITVEKGTGQIDLETSNGAIAIDAKHALLNVHTSNGGIRFTGSLVDGEHTLRSSNGGIKIELPADAHFRVDAATSNGRVTSDFPVSGSDKGRARLRGMVGDGQAVSLRLNTSNSNIEIRKGG